MSHVIQDTSFEDNLFVITLFARLVDTPKLNFAGCNTKRIRIAVGDEKQ